MTAAGHPTRRRPYSVEDDVVWLMQNQMADLCRNSILYTLLGIIRTCLCKSLHSISQFLRGALLILIMGLPRREQSKRTDR